MDRAYARRQMVRQQVRTWDVFDDQTLEILNRLNRHDFVPTKFVDLAYADTRLPLPHGQEMMAPLVEGRVLQALDPAPGDRAFEIGAGSGFFAACLASMADSVLTVDIFDELVSMSRQNLAHAEVQNVEVRSMDVTEELPNEEFDVIAVTGSMTALDERLIGALKTGGRLFAIIGDAPVMEACLVRRTDNGWNRTVLFETCIRPLIHAGRKSTFTF